MAKQLKNHTEIDNVPKIMKKIGGEASLDSAKRHPTIFKFVSPGSGSEILKYIRMLWYTVFGTTMKYEVINEENLEESDYLDMYIDNCPLCQGYYSDELDLSKEDMEKIFGKTGYACLLIGMIESVGNYMLDMKNLPYTMKIEEVECKALGAPRMRIKATLIPKESE